MNNQNKLDIDYRSLLEASSDIVFIFDTQGKLNYMNSAWNSDIPTLTHIKEGIGYSEIIPANEVERADRLFHTVISERNKIIDEPLTLLCSDKSEKHFVATLAPLLQSGSDRVCGLICILRNITDNLDTRNKLEANSRELEENAKEQIKKSEEIKALQGLNNEIMQNSPYGIFMLDSSGVMLNENPALRKIMGRSENESLVGTNILKQKKILDAGFDSYLKKTIDEKKTQRYKNIKYVPITSEDELIINITFTPIFDEHGAVEKLLVIVEDNTEQSRIAERVNRAEQLSALGFLASGVAIELRNHANKMVMDLNFVKNNVQEHTPAADYVDSLVAELARIKNISEQLLSLSSTDDEDKKICDLAKIVSGHPLDVVIGRLKKDGFDMEIKTGPGKHTVLATKSQLQQVIGQFLENSEEAMPDKGRISVCIDNIESEDGSYVVLTIEDTGLGIPSENIKKIFHPFFTTKGESATGLGLMIASTIVENLNGSIAVKSIPGEGTTIKVVLPLAK